MASQLFNAYKVAAMKGQIAPTTDTIKAALLKSTWTPNIDTPVFFGDVNASESSGTGYTAGGVTLSGIAITQDNTNDRAVLDANDISIASTTISDYRYVAIYKSTGNNATSPLIGYIDLLGTKSTNGDTAYIQFNALGVFYLN